MRAFPTRSAPGRSMSSIAVSSTSPKAVAYAVRCLIVADDEDQISALSAAADQLAWREAVEKTLSAQMPPNPCGGTSGRVADRRRRRPGKARKPLLIKDHLYSIATNPKMLGWWRETFWKATAADSR
jgi:hypothetical protein